LLHPEPNTFIERTGDASHFPAHLEEGVRSHTHFNMLPKYHLEEIIKETDKEEEEYNTDMLE
jgi:hypothetical protein